MILNKYTYLIVILFLFSNCRKDKENNSTLCTTYPCGDIQSNWKQVNNRVASVPEFRKGKWKNVRASSPVTNSLIFHNDSVCSFTSTSINHHKYRFLFLTLTIYADENGVPYPNYVKLQLQTYYNDTTGVLSILNQFNGGYQSWDHFIKIE